MKRARPGEISIRPMTALRWEDLAKLFGPRGACGGCWCMWWRILRSAFAQRKGDRNRNTLRHLIAAGNALGLLAYADGEPIGWCSIGPREAFPVLNRSKVLKRVDDAPVWSVVCFFVARSFRRQGVATSLLRAAVNYAKAEGAHIIEGYPIDPTTRAYPDTFAFTGLASTFRSAGFVEIARRTRARPIMRYVIKPRGTSASRTAPPQRRSTSV